MENTLITINTYVGNEHYDVEGQYLEFLIGIDNYFMSHKNQVLFKTNVKNLFNIFLDNLPEWARQHYTCSHCRHFINKYGGLVFSTPDGNNLVSALWSDENTPSFFAKAVEAMKDAVVRSDIKGVFKTDKLTLGHPLTNEWRHLSVSVPYKMDCYELRKSPSQIMSEKQEEFKMIDNGLKEYPIEIINKALLLVRTESLTRGEKIFGCVEWLKSLYDNLSKVKNERIRKNIIWLATATAPTGFAHFKNTMV